MPRISTPPCRPPATHLQSFILPRLHVVTPTARPQTSRPPYHYACSTPPKIHTYTSTSVPTARLQNSMPPRRYTYSTPSDLHTFTSTRLQRASRPPYRYTYIAPLNFQSSSTPPHPQVHSAPQELHTSISPYVHVATPTVRLQSSKPPTSVPLHLQPPSRRLFYHASVSPRMQRASRPPDLHISIRPCHYTCILP